MIPGIHIASSEMVVRTDPGKGSGPLLKNNQEVKAQVLKLQPPHGAELLINGKKLLVKTHIPLKQGEDIHLKVTVQKDGFVLKLLGPPAGAVPLKSVTALFQSLTGTLSGQSAQPLSQGQVSQGSALMNMFKASLPELHQIMEQIALKSSERDDDFLPRLMEKGGMLWEKKLSTAFRDSGSQALIRQLDQMTAQDLKAAALQQAARGLTASPAGGETGPSGSQALAQTLESLQLLNNLSSESGRFLLPFPVLTEAGFNLGQLLIDLGDKDGGRENDKIIRISFLLDMTRLGGVRADFSVLNKAVTGRFLLADPDTCDFIAQNIPELKARFEKLSYQVHRIECDVAQPAETEPHIFMESLFKGREDRVLNLVI